MSPTPARRARLAPLAGLLFLLGVASPAPADGAPADPTPAPSASSASAGATARAERNAAAAAAIDRPPEPAEAMAAYRILRGWVDSWSFPLEMPGRNAPPDQRLPSAAGACVLLLLDGAVIGRGRVTTLGGGISGTAQPAASPSPAPGGSGAAPGPVALESGESTIYRAALAAFVDADRQLKLPRDATRAARVRELAQRITISIELAGPLVPITPVEREDLDVTLAPGIDGVAVRLAGRIANANPAGPGSGTSSSRGGGTLIDAAWPSELMVENQPLSQGVVAPIARVTDQPALGLERPADLRERHALAFFRFRTTHLAQPDAGREPVFLFRGARQVAMSDVDSVEKLRAWADSLASYLVDQQRPEVVAEANGVVGGRVATLSTPRFAASYDAWRSTTEAEPSSPEARALALLALRRYAMIRPQAERATEMLEIAQAAALLAADPGAPSGDWSLAEGVLLNESSRLMDAKWAFAQQPALAARVRDAAMADLRASAAAAQRPPDAPDATGPNARPAAPARSMTTLALLALVDSPDAPQASAARAKLGEIFALAKPELLVGEMPWLGYAALRAAGSGGSAGPSAGGGVVGAPELRAIRRLLWEHQLSVVDAGLDAPDLVGGVVFTGARNPLPTWHMARPLVFVARMLADERLTPAGERGSELVRLLGALRFLRQLTRDESSSWLARDASLAIGGVRAAPWDQRQPLEATAMTLLALVESIEAIERLAGAPTLTPPTAP